MVQVMVPIFYWGEGDTFENFLHFNFLMNLKHLILFSNGHS